MTPSAIKKHLKEVRKLVKSNFTYEFTEKQYAQEANFVLPEADYDGTQAITGDCEDFALHCRKLLNDRGVKSRLMQCTVDGKEHVVLEASGIVIDSIQGVPSAHTTLAEKKKYIFTKVSGYEPGAPWHLLKRS